MKIKTHDLRSKRNQPGDDSNGTSKGEEKPVSETREEEVEKNPPEKENMTPKEPPKPKRKSPQSRRTRTTPARGSSARQQKDSGESRKPQEQSVRAHSAIRTDERRDPDPPFSDKEMQSRRTPSLRRNAPVIGITAGYQYCPDVAPQTEEYFYVYEPYIRAIHDAGGVPIIIPTGLESRFSNKVMTVLDGLLLAGGIDVDPSRYNDHPNMNLGKVDPKRDRTEIDLFNLAFNLNLPILGICRGIQLINVALDGTLHQDLPSLVRMAMDHFPKFPPNEPVHRIYIEDKSQLRKILGESSLRVNSTHHQGIKLLGKGMEISAKAPDGIIEAIEHPTKRWVIGVQWHPELMWPLDKIMGKLFLAFVEACKA
ncbi:MAG: gamma-glutamyl-gamma-aminobutyrate hydrolase family protein [bacterium]